jgi:cytochrome c oxidase subunit 2
MDVHRFEKVWFALSMVLIVAWISTVAYGAIGPGVEMVDDSGGTVDADDPTASENFREPGVYKTGDDQFEVYVEAAQFQFTPGTQNPIRLPTNSTVTFYVTSTDVVHGFEVAGTNVNTMVIPGQVTEMTVEFDEPATYGIVCNEYCGGGHHTMEGKLEVVPRSEFNATEVES